ncbi:unnamed protein product [Gadus morhua 'NCC']
MSEASTHHPLGLLFKDDNRSGDLVDVLQHLKKEHLSKSKAPALHGGQRQQEDRPLRGEDGQGAHKAPIHAKAIAFAWMGARRS